MKKIPALSAALYSPYGQALTMCEHLLEVSCESGDASEVGA